MGSHFVLSGFAAVYLGTPMRVSSP
jgi:hypothetical protein